MASAREIIKYSGCFVCGDKNHCGLNARFCRDDTKAVTELVAFEHFEGYPGIYHGGILSTLLDEVMIKAALAADRHVVTAEMTTRFLRPVKTGDRVRLSGWITRSKGQVIVTEGKAVGTDGREYATAYGKYVEADPDLEAILTQSV